MGVKVGLTIDEKNNSILEGYFPEDKTTYLKGDTLYLQNWLKVYKTRVDGKYKLRIEMKENTSDSIRACSLLVGRYVTNKKSPVVAYSGNVFILQDYKRDNDESFAVNIRYKGKLYTSQATLDSNGNLVYQDNSFAQLMDSLSNAKDINAIVTESDVVVYYDAQDLQRDNTLRKIIQRAHKSPLVHRGAEKVASRMSYTDGFRFCDANALGYFALFDDTKFRDTHFYQNLTDLTASYDNTFLKNIGLNDKASSLAVAYQGTDPALCSVLTIWEDSNYNFGDNDRTKHRISIIASVQNPQVSYHRLQSLPLIHGAGTWNDRISSISFHFGYVDSALKDY